MHFASLFFGTSVIAIALGLESHRRRHDQTMVPTTQVDQDYMRTRRRYRLWTNWLIGFIGVLAAAAGVVGAGPIWIVLWAIIPLLVVAITLLAFTDAVTTNSYLHRKLPELRAEHLGGTHSVGVSGLEDSALTDASHEQVEEQR